MSKKKCKRIIQTVQQTCPKYKKKKSSILINGLDKMNKTKTAQTNLHGVLANTCAIHNNNNK